MKRRIIVIISGLIILLLIGVGCATMKKPLNSNEKVIDEQEAIEIAKEYVFGKYQKSFDDYTIITELKDNIWTVSYMIGEPFVDGGGGPALKIKESNGEVVSCALQK